MFAGFCKIAIAALCLADGQEVGTSGPLIVNPADHSSLPPFQFQDLRVGAAAPKDANKAGFLRCSRYSKFTDCIFDYDLRVGGVPAFGAASYRDNSFYILQLTFNASVGAAILAALRERYGQPCDTGNGTVQNGYGATFRREYATWCFSDGKATFQSLGQKRDEGSFSFLSSDELQRRALPSKPVVDF